jgi:hypothetical protein
MPHAAILHHFGWHNRATILTGEDPRTRKQDLSFSRLDTVLPALRGKSFTFPAVNGLYFFRFLAKTAHCAAFAASPWGGFKPYLKNLILEGGDDLVEAAMYIGTIDETVQHSDEILHAVEVRWVDADTYMAPMLGSVRKKLLIVKINLFVNHSSHPTYEVVVGEADSAEVRILPRESKW